jgi:hypothetical protein
MFACADSTTDHRSAKDGRGWDTLAIFAGLVKNDTLDDL